LAAQLLAARTSDEPSLKEVLLRSAAYATDYHQRFTALVAEERYVQRVALARAGTPDNPNPISPHQERLLKSDYILLHDFAGPNSWVGVREVLEVNGEPVTVDRERMQSLLDDTTRPLQSRLRALADLQTKYNLGDVYRTINVPTLPLEFLLPDRQPRFHFKHAGKTTAHDRPVWIVSFSERDRPTIIRTPDGHDIQSSGSFWIDPGTGAVVRSELRTGEIPGRPLRTIILVSYSHNPRFDMLLPDDMNELYLTGRTRIEGHATYSNYRRWEAEATIK
jgi:WD40 repeat protein